MTTAGSRPWKAWEGAANATGDDDCSNVTRPSAPGARAKSSPGPAVTGPFGRSACAHLGAGWYPFPLPAAKKSPPPGGVTGWAGVDLSGRHIRALAAGSGRNANIGIRMPKGVIGVDVDAYPPKLGGESLDALEHELGPLPATPRLTARAADDPVSGIRFFRIPDETVLVGQAGPGIEIIQRHHRFAVTAPSIHPTLKTPYEWVGPDGRVVAGVPDAASLPLLPGGWLRCLTDGGRTGASMAVAASPQTAEMVLSAGFRSVLPGAPCSAMLRAVGEVLKLLADGSRHAAITGPLMRLCRLARAGHRGLQDALLQVQDDFLDRVCEDRPGGRAEAEREWGRSVTGAFQQVFGKGPAIGRWATCPCMIAHISRTIRVDPSLSVRERQVLRYLLLRARFGGCLQIKESQRQIGEAIDVHQVEVSKIMKGLREKGWLIRDKGGKPWAQDTNVAKVPVVLKSLSTTNPAVSNVGSQSFYCEPRALVHRLFGPAGLGAAVAETFAALPEWHRVLPNGHLVRVLPGSSLTPLLLNPLRAQRTLPPPWYGPGVTVEQIARSTGRAAPTVSRHLQRLYGKRLIFSQRHGREPARWWRYRFDPDVVADRDHIPDTAQAKAHKHAAERIRFFNDLSSSAGSPSPLVRQERFGQIRYLERATGELVWTQPAAAGVPYLGPLLDVSGLPGGRLLAHQLDAARFCLDNPRALLLHDAGLGKTATVAALISALYHRGELAVDDSDRVLWLTAPRLVQKTVQDLQALLPSLRVRSGAGKAPGPADVLVLSPHALLRRPACQARHRGLVVLGEILELKGGGPMTHAAREVSAQARRVVGLAARLWDKHPLELFEVCSVIAPIGLPMRLNYCHRFVDFLPEQKITYGRKVVWQEPRPYGLKPGSAQQLAQMLAPFVHYCSADDVPAAMPTLIQRTEWLTPDSEQQRRYRRAERNGRWPGRRAKLLDDACRPGAWPNAKSAATRALVSTLPGQLKAVILARDTSEAGELTNVLEAQVGCVLIDQASSLERRDRLDLFRSDPSIRVLIGSEPFVGIEGFAPADLIIGYDVLTAAQEQKIVGCIRSLGSTRSPVTRLTLLTDTPYERTKAKERAEKDLEQQLVIAALKLPPSLEGDLLSTR